tara:strand:+ start:143 stop:406 length:264 start_codon:yes stop_codon:yes gene_type:complete
MACKNCKKNASKLTAALKSKLQEGDEPKTTCEEGRREVREWLNSEEGKNIQSHFSLNITEKTITWVFGYIPLIIGYLSILRFIINLF